MKYIISILFVFSCFLKSYTQNNAIRGVGLFSPVDTASKTGNTYAVIVGISDYKYIKPLSFADQDALLFREFLLSRAGGSVKPDNVLLLVNKDANASTQPRIRHWLSSTIKPKKGDRVYFYFAGHGDAIDADEYFFLLQDCDPGGDKNNYTAGMASVIQMYNIKTFIKNSLIENGVEVVLIWDACRTNELPGGENGLRKMQEGIAEKTNGESIMLSASAGEVAIENNSYAHGHGLFTYYLIDGLNGAADKPEVGGNNDGKVDISELDTWVKMQVRRDAQTKFKTSQNPKFIYNSTETLSITDAGFLQVWNMQKQHSEDMSLKYKNNNGRGMQKADSIIADLYNRFMEAVKADSLEGAKGAEALYSEMKRKYPLHEMTDEAGFNLAMEYINLAQDKINFYLSGKDEARILTQTIEGKETRTSISKIKVAVSHNFSTHGRYLQRADSLLKNYKEIDAEYLQQLRAKANFLLAMGYCENEGVITDFSTAMKLAKEAIASKPDAAYNNHLLGMLFEYSENYDSSILYEQKALKFAPDWNKVLLSIGNVYLDKERYDSAKLYFQRNILASSDSPNERNYNALGNALHCLKQFDSAETNYRRAIEINLKDQYGYNNLGINFYDQKLYDSAQKYFIKIFAIEKNCSYAYHNLGLCFYAQKQYDSAETNYRKAIIIDPKNKDAYNSLGINFYSQKVYDSAEKYFRKIFAIDKSYSYAYYNLGLYFDIQEQSDSARVYYYKAIAVGAKYANVYARVGFNYHQQKEYDSAELYFRKAIVFDVKNPFAYFSLGMIFKDQRNYDSSELYLRKAIKFCEESSASSHKNLDGNFDQRRKYGSAITNNHGEFVVDAGYVLALRNLASNFNDQGKYDSAEFYYRKALDKDPYDGINYYLLGSSFNNQKKYDSAKAYYQKTVSLDPNYVYVYNSLANNFYDQKEYDSAEMYYRKTISIKPNYVYAYNNLAYIFYDQKKYDSATLYYHKAIAIDSKNQNAYYNLACIASINQKSYEAIKNLELSFQNGYDDYGHIKEDTDLDNVRNTEEYKKLIKKYFPNK